MHKPLIGITMDIVEVEGRARAAMYPSYAQAIEKAGGVPVMLPHQVGAIGEYCERLAGFVFTGGDDPIMEEFGEVTDARVTRLHPDRQRFEVELLREAMACDKPMLGICLGMQLMALVSGGSLDQHLAESAAEIHWEHEHEVVPEFGASIVGGSVMSRHRQAVSEEGTLRVLGRAPDGVIEALGDADRRFFLGVQWHPERTRDDGLGLSLFADLVRSAARA